MSLFNDISADKCGATFEYVEKLNGFKFEVLLGQCNMTVVSRFERGQRFIKFTTKLTVRDSEYIVFRIIVFHRC